MATNDDWLAEAVDRLKAQLIVVRTGPELTPGQRDRNALLDRQHRANVKTYVGNDDALLESLRAGEFPSWSFAWYGGYPLLEFYAPLYYFSVPVFRTAIWFVGLGATLYLALHVVLQVLL